MPYQSSTSLLNMLQPQHHPETLGLPQEHILHGQTSDQSLLCPHTAVSLVPLLYSFGTQ